MRTKSPFNRHLLSRSFGGGPVALLLAAVALGVLLCVPALYNSEFDFNSDEAVNALVVKHMLEGREFSLFNWDTTYYGVIEGDLELRRQLVVPEFPGEVDEQLPAVVVRQLSRQDGLERLRDRRPRVGQDLYEAERRDHEGVGARAHHGRVAAGRPYRASVGPA